MGRSRIKKGRSPPFKFINGMENYAPPPVIELLVVLPTAVPTPVPWELGLRCHISMISVTVTGSLVPYAN